MDKDKKVKQVFSVLAGLTIKEAREVILECNWQISCMQNELTKDERLWIEDEMPFKEDNKKSQESLESPLVMLDKAEKNHEKMRRSIMIDRYISVGVLICVLLSIVIRIFLAMG